VSEYYRAALEKGKALREREDFYILAVETSCDETAVAVLRGKEIKSSVIMSQIDIHKRFGGVVPEIASRNHTAAIDNIVECALNEAGVSLTQIEAIAVTYGAGLLGALIVGVSYAKSLAYALNIPIYGINHIKGHIFANFAFQDMQPPVIALIASGGHTALAKVQSYKDIEILGSTRDDAAGEAFDKVARVLGLSYPGGPKISALAKTGQNSIKMPRPFKGEGHLDFSFSGLKTFIVNLAHNYEQRGEAIPAADIAHSFQGEVCSILTENTIKAVRLTGIKKVVLAGGVGANDLLREKLSSACLALGAELSMPEKKHCTDNAAMIGVACYYAIKDNLSPSDLTLDAKAELKVWE
jgi:N6-L-threonylcarbamoyladenine synthase